MMAKQLICDLRLSMFQESVRLATFKNWVFDDYQKCNAIKMAESGFFYMGNDDEPDLVQCFMCGKALDGWEPSDDPWDEHYSHSPSCTFAKNMLNEESYTLSDLLDLKRELIKSITIEMKEAIKSHYKTMIEMFENATNLKHINQHL